MISNIYCPILFVKALKSFLFICKINIFSIKKISNNFKIRRCGKSTYNPPPCFKAHKSSIAKFQ